MPGVRLKVAFCTVSEVPGAGPGCAAESSKRSPGQGWKVHKECPSLACEVAVMPLVVQCHTTPHCNCQVSDVGDCDGALRTRASSLPFPGRTSVDSRIFSRVCRGNGTTAIPPVT